MALWISSIQNEEMAVDNMSAGDIAKKAEVHGDGDMNGLERSLSAGDYWPCYTNMKAESSQLILTSIMLSPS